MENQKIQQKKNSVFLNKSLNKYYLTDLKLRKLCEYKFNLLNKIQIIYNQNEFKLIYPDNFDKMLEYFDKLISNRKQFLLEKYINLN